MGTLMHMKIRGFTISELLIMIAFISIIATMALPAYKDYNVRTRVSEMILSTSDIKMQIGTFVENNVTLTGSGAGITIGTKSPYVSAIHVAENGEITLLGASRDLGSNEEISVYLTPSLSSTGILIWSCSTQSGFRYVPEICQSTY